MACPKTQLFGHAGDTAISLGTVSLGSTFGAPVFGIFAGSDQNNTGGPVSDIGSTQVPVPEPATVALLGVGLLGVIGARILKRN